METLEILEQEVLDTQLSDDMVTMLQESGFDFSNYLMLEAIYGESE